MNTGINENYYLTPLMKLTESYLYYSAKVYKEETKIKTRLEEIYTTGRDNILNATSVKEIFQSYVDAASKLLIFYKKLYEPKLESEPVTYSWNPPTIMNCSDLHYSTEVPSITSCDLFPTSYTETTIGSASFPYITDSTNMSTFAKGLFNTCSSETTSKNPLTYLKDKDFKEHYKDTLNLKNIRE